MAIRIPLQSIVIQRDGKNVIPEVGKAFDFTEQELRDIAAVAPNAVRLPINEAASAEAAAAQVADTSSTAASTDTSAADARKAKSSKDAEL